MPYASVADLPERIKSKYSAKAQKAFVGAFNSAYSGTCAERKNRESCAFAKATSAANRVAKRELQRKAIIEVVQAIFTKPPADSKQSWARAVPITKVDDDKRVVYGPVLEPDVEDSQGDIVSVEEVERAAHRFLKKVADGKAHADGVMHELRVGPERAQLVESWVEHADTQHGEHTIKQGTWMIGVHIPDDTLWSAIKDGTLTGFSIGGMGVRT